MNINHLDLFSGIGGFALGLKQAGFKVKKHYFSEVDKHAIANYKYNFKEAEYVGSVTDVRGRELERPTIITFGSPCQDFSLAGKRKGLEGHRSGLILEAIRLISETRPDVFIWENVKGTFSSNEGRDFQAILREFTNIGGYRLEWQLLNTSWLLPQNRERIYLIGHLGNRGGRNVFPFGEDDCVFDKSIRSGGRQSQTQHCSTIVRPGMGSKADDTFIATTLNGSSAKMVASDTYIKVKSATNQGFEEATEGDSINLSQPNSETRRGRVGKGKAQTLETSCNQGVIQINPSIESGGKQPYQQNRMYDKDEIAPTIDQAAGKWSVNTARIRRLTEIECERLQGFPDNWTKYGYYVKTSDIRSQKSDAGHHTSESENLKSDISHLKATPISRTQRYKMCGNAVTVAIVKMIAQRLREGMELKKEGKQ